MADRHDYSNERSCATCAYAIFQDVGYSNYTVEGTEFECGLNLHPHPGFDTFYKTADELAYGKQCVGYQKGEPFDFDVDGEVEEILNKAPTETWKVIQIVRRMKGNGS